MFNNKVVLITGGTGSFGRQFIRTVLERFTPRQVIILSRDELKQFEMNQQFRSDKLRFLLGDVRDSNRLMQAMRGVDYVVHAAALKQVPAAEYNPMEFIRTNVLGAENVINAALACSVKKVIALSTGKAVNPVNLYGATKLCSDKLFVAANDMCTGRDTRFAVVRYGNVAGSRGSVIPFFHRLLQDGARELPVTDKRMTRFWITQQDCVHFFLDILNRMQGGEVFVPKQPSARITDLAEAMAPGMPVKIIGIRPGEKLHEVMCPSDDAHLTLEFSNHFVLKPSIEFPFQVNYTRDLTGESGQPVAMDFEYTSSTNPQVLSVEELRTLVCKTNMDHS